MADTVYNSTGGVNATTPTDTTKKKNLNLPYMQTGQNQAMPLASTAVNAGANASGATTGPLAPVQPMQSLPTVTNQEQRVQNTYQQASQQPQDPLQSLIGETYTKQIQGYGQNANQNLQNTLENYDVQQAKAYEAARQAGAASADSGIFQNELLQNQLQNLRDRGNLEQTTKTANLENLNKVLSGAQSSATQSATNYNDYIKNLISATQAGEGEATREQQTKEAQLDRAQELLVQSNDIQGQKDIETLKAKFAENQATTDYERTAAQKALDRAHDIAIQQGDIAGQLEIEKLKGQIDAQIEKEKQTWQTGERVASQIFTTTERISTENYDAGQKYLDRENQKSIQMQEYYNNLNIQSNEFNQEKTMAQINSDLEEAKANNDYSRTAALTKLQSALQAGLQDDAQAAAKELAQLEQSNQRYLQEQTANLQLKMQLQDFDHDSQMKYLDAQIANTKANGDTERSKQLMAYQTQLNIQELGAKATYDEKKAYLDNELAKALQDNDAEHAEVLQKERLNQDAQQFADEMIIKKAAQALEEKKVDMAQIESDYNKVVEMYGEDSEAAHEFLVNTLNANGIDTSGSEYDYVDATEQAKKALASEYDLQKEQFIQSHPEYTDSTYSINMNNVNAIMKDNNAAAQKLLEKMNYNLNTPISASDLADAGISADMIRQYFTPIQQGTDISRAGVSAFNEYLNSAIYGELTAEQKAAKETAGYLGASDLAVAAEGDKYNITEPTNYEGKTIPAGKYTVKTSEVGHGNKFFGTKYTNTHTYLVNSDTGEEIEIGTKKSGTEGNIVSNLWAG